MKLFKYLIFSWSVLFLSSMLTAQTWVEDLNSPFTNGAVEVRTYYNAQYNGKAVSCQGNSDAEVKVEVTGSSSFDVTWISSGQNLNSSPALFSNLSSGTYSISVFDYDNFIDVSAEIAIPGVSVLKVVNNVNLTKVLLYPTCHDQADGRIRATVAGGTSPYTYEWVGNGSVSTVSNPLGLGSYTFRVTDINLCQTDSTFVIDTPSVILPNPDIASLGCGGGNDGALTSIPTGGNGGFTYSWNTSPAQTTQTTTPTLSTGTYIVTVTDANLCTASESIALTPPTPITSSSSETLTLCSNSSDGTSTITVSGGLAPYNLSWTGPAAGNPAGDEIDTDGGNYVISSLAAGSYSVTITDASGCTESESFTITNPVALSQTNTKTHVTCNGDGNGAINLTVSGGNPPYDISWTGAAIGSQSDAINSSGGSYSIGSLSGGNYDLTITDNNGCILNSNSHTINEPAVLSQTNVSTDVSCNGGINDGQIEVTVNGGTAPYQVSWTGTAIGDPLGDEISLDGGDYTIGTLDNGNYLVTVKDANNCQISFPKTIFEPTAITASISSSTPVSCNGGSDGTATANVSGGTLPYDYSWSNGQTLSGDVTGTNTVTGLAQGNISITITDGKGCTATDNTTITEPAVLSATMGSPSMVSCNGGNNGSVTVTGSGGTAATDYTYSWNTTPVQTTATASNLVAGSYSVTITDDNNCIASAGPISITEPSALSASIGIPSMVSCNGGNNGSATVTGSGGTAAIDYTYSWNTTPVQTTATASNLVAGNYTVTVTDDNGCIATDNVGITEPTVLAATMGTPTAVSCNGAVPADGSVTVVASGGTVAGNYTYLWSDGQTTATASNLSAGNYSVTITDDNSCSVAAGPVTITEPSAVVASIGIPSMVSCNGGNDGSVTVTASGGTVVGTYTYLWSDGQTTATANNLAIGNYSVTVTDDNSCTANAGPVTITEVTAITQSNIKTHVLCNGDANGNIELTVNGGTEPYNISWSGSATGNPPGDEVWTGVVFQEYV